ncbi:MAG: hypothetical protein ACK55Z_22930, partial [bacterium]
DCDDDIFFEDIIVFSSKAALRVQRLLKQAENLDRQNTLKNLRLLKNNGFNENFDEIQVLENRLNLWEEGINSDKVINYLKTTILNDEKITTQFLRLAKTLHTDSLEKICKDNGEPFACKKDREKHIVELYKKLYSLPENMPADFSNCIENFLGPQICLNPVVQNSKLSDEERIDLDRPLGITELDESVKKLNLRSAPGID